MRPTRQPPSHAQRVKEIVNLLRQTKNSGELENKEEEPEEPRIESEKKTTPQNNKRTSCFNSVFCCAGENHKKQSRGTVDDGDPNKTKQMIMQNESTDVSKSSDGREKEVPIWPIHQHSPQYAHHYNETIHKEKVTKQGYKGREQKTGVDLQELGDTKEQASRELSFTFTEGKRNCDVGNTKLVDVTQPKSKRYLENIQQNHFFFQGENLHNYDVKGDATTREIQVEPDLNKRQQPRGKTGHVTWATPLQSIVWPHDISKLHYTS